MGIPPLLGRSVNPMLFERRDARIRGRNAKVLLGPLRSSFAEIPQEMPRVIWDRSSVAAKIDDSLHRVELLFAVSRERRHES